MTIRRDAKISSICLWLGTLDEEDVDLVDDFVMDLVRDNRSSEIVTRRRERIARSLSASAAVSPACGGRAHPSRDESAGDAPAGSGARTSSGPLPRGNEPARSALPDAPAVVARESATFLTPIERGPSELANANFGLATGLLDDRGVEVQLEQIEDVHDEFDVGGEAE